ncbi:MAG: portal protein [Candidatus Velthaea sp.]
MQNQNEKTTSPRDNRDLLKRALDNFKIAAEAERPIRDAALEDLKFWSGEQWPDQVKRDRASDGRPCLTINRLPQFTKQVSNEQRRNRPEIQINPVSGGADEDTAKIFAGMIRHIELASNADIAYDTAFESALVSSFGFFRVRTDYEDPMSLDQEIKIDRVANPFTVYFDPNAKEPDYSDAMWAFVVSDISGEAYKREYPKSDAASMDNFSSIGDANPEWATDETIRVVEYFEVETEKATLCKLRDGSTKLAEDVQVGEAIVSTRPTEVRKVTWYKLNAVEVLEQQDWAGQFIPIVPVLGDEFIVDGKRKLVSLIRYAQDAQRMYNYWVSAQTEMIALAPKAPYLVAEGQIEGHENEWAQANTRNMPTLTYKAKSVNNELIGAPQRSTAEPPIEAISRAIEQSSNDLKATMGIYDDSLGEGHNDKSGKAILARQKQGDTANAHFIDNLARSQKFCGRLLIDLIPKIYDSPRAIRIVQPDRSSEIVQINKVFQKPGSIGNSGFAKYDLALGRYDVTVSTGPGYESKRQEAVQSMLQLAESFPPMLSVIGDLMVQQMDWPGADAIAERLKKMLPPQLQDEKDGKNAPPVPPQVQQQLAAMGNMIQQLTATVHQQATMIETDQVKVSGQMQMKQLETESRERIAAMGAQVALIQTEATINAKNAQTLLVGELASVKHRLDLIQGGQSQQADQQHEAQMQDADQQHQAGMQQASQEADAQGQQADQQHQVGMAADAQAHQANLQSDAQSAAADQQAAALKAQPMKKAA